MAVDGAGAGVPPACDDRRQGVPAGVRPLLGRLRLRLDMQIEVRRIQPLAGIPTVLVTHDQDEAMSMADRVAVLNGGVLEQVGTPIDVYDRPRSLFVNTFVGISNLLPGRIDTLDGAHAAVPLDVGARLRG
jgi:putative spermidine/putrescine transport system ATP-binding protein